MPMGKNSTIFYLVNNSNQNQNQVLLDDVFENTDEDENEEVFNYLNNLEFKVHEHVLEKVFDFAKKFTV